MSKFIYFIIISINLSSFLFSYIVSGTILSDKNKPLQGSSVVLSSDENAYIGLSDINGYYQIPDIKEGEYNLKISYLGYVNINDIVYIKENVIYDFTLIESLINFNQVVVTGSKNENFIKDSPLLTHVITNDDIKRSPYISTKGVLELIFPNNIPNYQIIFFLI